MTLPRWFRTASIVIVCLAATAGAVFSVLRQVPDVGPVFLRWWRSPRTDAGFVDKGLVQVKPGDLRITVRASGELESAQSLDVFCQVEGETTVISLVPEGTRVSKGQLICELDSAALNDQLTIQKIATQGAEAAYQNARLAREAAELGPKEYEEGPYREEVEGLNRQVLAAESSIPSAGSWRERTEQAYKQLAGLLSRKKKDEWSAAEIAAEIDLAHHRDTAQRALSSGKWDLEQLRAKQSVLEKYTRPTKLRELRSKVEEARSLERARQETWQLEKKKSAKLERQIANCKILAPRGGLVRYADDPGPYGLPQIEEGATVRERQRILSFPDNSQIRVNVKVPETSIGRLSPGLRARIRVAGFEDAPLFGVVASVAPRPFVQPDKGRVFTTIVSITDRFTGIRPGMSAGVEILAYELNNVLAVPDTSVVDYDGKRRLAVKTHDGGVEWREVSLGVSDGKMREIKTGLRSGEYVVVDPAAILSEQQKQKIRSRDDWPKEATKVGTPAKAKGTRVGLPPALRAKMAAMSPEDRQLMIGASPQDRDAILKRAGLTEDEIRLLTRSQPRR